jgi:hypothetical protein
MKWSMKDARLWETRLWNGLCKKHAYERRAYEIDIIISRCFIRGLIFEVEKGFWESRPLPHRNTGCLLHPVMPPSFLLLDLLSWLNDTSIDSL